MDDSVSPIAPIGSEPPEALDPPVARIPTAAEVERTATAAAEVADVERAVATSNDVEDVRVAAQITRAQLERPIVPPANSGVVADVHDAAEHGNAIADAIERAHTADPSDRAQQLGGAAASAASGQSTPADEPPPTVDVDDRDPRVDPLAPIDPNRPAQARDPREEQGRTSK